MSKNLSLYKTNWPDAWAKIENDQSIKTETEFIEYSPDSSGGSPKKYSATSTASGMDGFLSSLPELPVEEIKERAKIFFRANKKRGEIEIPSDDEVFGSVIAMENLISLYQRFLAKSRYFLTDSANDAEIFEELASANTADLTSVVHKFKEGYMASPLQWCFRFEPLEFLAHAISDKFLLPCVLGVPGYQSSQHMLVLSIKPTRVYIPTAFDGGSGLYKEWVPGGKTQPLKMCLSKPEAGKEEYVFTPGDKAEIVHASLFFCCKKYPA